MAFMTVFSMRMLYVAGLLFVLAIEFRPAFAIDIEFDAVGAGILEDVILVASAGGACPYHSIALGDLDLSKTKHVIDFKLDTALTHWWLMGHLNGEVVYSSNSNLVGSDLHSIEPYDTPDADLEWTALAIVFNLNDYVESRAQWSFGVMTDTHYYSEPLGTPHPVQSSAAPGSMDLKDNLNKIQLTLDKFGQENVAFGVFLGDVVEDHASWPTDTTFIGNGALVQNLDDLESVFGLYNFPIHLVAGNHDVSYGTSRFDLYNNSSFYSQESYDNNDYSTRLDYVFEVGNVRFIVYDDVQRNPGAGGGFRSAGTQTLAYLEHELAKVSVGGIDEGKPVVVMAHVRADCVDTEGCNTKIDLTNDTAYRWTLSAGGADEYYLEASTGGDPGLEDEWGFNRFLWEDGISLSKQTIGSLQPGQWVYGNNPTDGLTYDTVYIRLSTSVGVNSWDPDDATPGYIQYKYVNAHVAENYEEIVPIFEQAVSNGANILGVLQGHGHTSIHNTVNGVDYYSFASFKRTGVTEAYAIIDVMIDNTLSIQGFGSQASFPRYLHNDEYGCANPPVLSRWWERVLSNHGSHVAVNAASSSLWGFSNTTNKITDLSINLHRTVYEDGEDGTTGGWSIYDNLPAGAMISNVYDVDRQSRVIELSGTTLDNGYVLGPDDLSPWGNTTQLHIEWSMRYNEGYTIFVEVQTTAGRDTAGRRYMTYTEADTDSLGTERFVRHGLGSDTIDGQWWTITRDLQADLEDAQPGLTITGVNAFLVRGSGRLDDIKLLSWLPIDTDNDSIEDYYDNCPLISNVSQLDSDNDGQGDVCDTDDDNDGLSDVFELSINTNPFLNDTDGDGVSDYTEVNFDGFPAYDPNFDMNPLSQNTDNDAYLDGVDPVPVSFNFEDGDVAPYGSPDSIINTGDLLVGMQLILGTKETTDLEKAHLDLYPVGAPDGEITISDYILLQKLLW